MCESTGGKGELMKIPVYTENIIKRLQENGFRAFAAGGCIRDSLQGIEPHDWDICTSAVPEEVMRVFSDCRVIPTGIKHGTVSVQLEDEGPFTEITTFRTESDYSDGRHPDAVSFVNELEEDLKRRDFTVNAMAYNPAEGLIDLFGGQEDLRAGVLRCVGDPDERFREDALRILRGLRFMSVKGLEAEPETREAILRNYSLLKNVSWERIDSEFIKFMCGQRAAELLDEYSEVFVFLIPELRAMIGFDQRSPYHNRDVWKHSLCAVADIPPRPVFRLTMLLHDVAKPVVCILDDNGRGRFVGHPAKGAEMAETILRRMKFPKKMIDHVETLVRYHDAKIRPERAEVRRWLGRLGDQIFDELMFVRHADASGKYEKYLGEAEEKNARLAALAESIRESGDCVDIAGLAINGDDLTRAGFSGPEIRKVLNWLLDEVIEERLENVKEDLLGAALSCNRSEVCF